MAVFSDNDDLFPVNDAWNKLSGHHTSRRMYGNSRSRGRTDSLEIYADLDYSSGSPDRAPVAPTIGVRRPRTCSCASVGTAMSDASLWHAEHELVGTTHKNQPVEPAGVVIPPRPPTPAALPGAPAGHGMAFSPHAPRTAAASAGAAPAPSGRYTAASSKSRKKARWSPSMAAVGDKPVPIRKPSQVGSLRSDAMVPLLVPPAQIAILNISGSEQSHSTTRRSAAGKQRGGSKQGRSLSVSSSSSSSSASSSSSGSSSTSSGSSSSSSDSGSSSDSDSSSSSSSSGSSGSSVTSLRRATAAVPSSVKRGRGTSPSSAHSRSTAKARSSASTAKPAARRAQAGAEPKKSATVKRPRKPKSLAAGKS